MAEEPIIHRTMEGAISPEIYSSLIRTTTLIEETSTVINGTIPTLKGTPYEKEVTSQYSEIKSSLDTITQRLGQVEETVFRMEREKETLKKLKELHFPERVLRKLPNDVVKIVQNAKKCFNVGLYDECATDMRKALIAAILIRFKIDKSERELYNEEGEPYGLPKMIELAKQKRYLSSSLARNLKRIKIFGGVGAHDYKIDLEKEDIIPIFEILRLALQHMYHECFKGKI